jgi:hypothetical protein
MPERVPPLEQNERARMLLDRLRRGPATTISLQSALPLVHVARQVWELRHWYGFVIRTTRLPNRVARYELIGMAPGNPETPAPADPVVPCPRCGDRLRDLRQTLDGLIVNGKCPNHGRQDVRLAA